MNSRRLRLRDQPALLLLCILLGLIICTVVAGVFAFSQFNADLYKSSTFASGSSPGAVDYARSGWLPGWFPKQAVDIDHTHDLDTNLSLTNFKLPATEAQALVTSSCLGWKTATDDLFVPGAFPRMEKWNKDHISKGIRSGSLQLYECNEGDRDHEKWVLAVESVTDSGMVRAFLWNDPTFEKSKR